MYTVIEVSDWECPWLFEGVDGNALGMSMVIGVLMGNALGMPMVIGGVDGEYPLDAHGY